MQLSYGKNCSWLQMVNEPIYRRDKALCLPGLVNKLIGYINQAQAGIHSAALHILLTMP
jgi:hypothetical protein